MALHRRTLRTRGLTVLAAVTVAAAAAAGTAQARMIGAFEVGGAIETEYDQVGGAALGDPTGPEADAAAGGKYQTFANNAAIYWHPDTNANTVAGQIRDKYAALGNESGTLGYPVTRELSTPAGNGRFNHFQRGSIYWSVGTGAHQISGPIKDKWAALGWESSPLGFPLTDVAKAGKADGQFTMFPTGAIYWSSTTGAHAVWGSIQADWIRAGAENGRYGYPTSDEYDYQGGKAQDFQGGKITWKPAG
ncbi:MULTISPECIES: LGFP repeat-containing protein [unclassified Nocardia]|uniref:LGFP repeat-containing protein n=1 Tax=Nocardia sp. NPDC050413 TaxID=3155784 RepID=UPI0033D05DBD